MPDIDQIQVEEYVDHDLAKQVDPIALQAAPEPSEEILAPEAATGQPEAEADPPPSDDTQIEAQPVTDGSQAEEPAPDTDERLARLLHRDREKNRKLAEQAAEIERLKGLRTETRDQELDRLADERATMKLRAKEFENATQTIMNNGNKQYGQQFGQAIAAMNDAFAQSGGTAEGFNLLCDGIIDAAGQAEGHKLIKHLGDNTDILEDVLKLPPVKLGVKLKDLAAKLSAPTIKPVSKAPAPIKSVSTSTASSGVDPMKMSMDEFAKWNLQQDRKRGWV